MGMLTLDVCVLNPLQALLYWLNTARALVASLVSPATVSLLLLPLASAKGQKGGHKGSRFGSDVVASGRGVGGAKGMGGLRGEGEEQERAVAASCGHTPASASSRASWSSSQGAELDSARVASGGGRERQWGEAEAEAGAGRGDETGAGSCQAVGEAELEELLSRLEMEMEGAEGPWEMIVDKASSSVDYCAWRRDPQVRPQARQTQGKCPSSHSWSCCKQSPPVLHCRKHCAHVR